MEGARDSKMDKAKTNHSGWIREALARYERPLIAYACRFTGDLETARDVVQDTFLKLCQADAARLNGRLAGWLYTVCRNRALDVSKKNRRSQPLEDGQAESIASQDPDPSDAAAASETKRLIVETVETLPETQQEVFRLKFEGGLTYREISAVTGMPLSTVSYQVHAAMTRVCERLRACTEAPGA